MGEAGDYWRDHRDHKRRQRNKMVECEGACLSAVVHNPHANLPKIPPGCKCHRCGWEAPANLKGNSLRRAT